MRIGHFLDEPVGASRGRWIQTFLATWSEEDASRFLADLGRFCADLDSTYSSITTNPLS